MLCVDVNVLVHAHRSDMPGHRDIAQWLDRARRGPEALGLVDVVLSGFLRIVTHRRVFREPSSLETALTFTSALRSSPVARNIQPGARHWRIFTSLCEDSEARGNLIPDAYLAALAIESGGTWITLDRGFARFPGLVWRHPLES